MKSVQNFSNSIKQGICTIYKSLLNLKHQLRIIQKALIHEKGDIFLNFELTDFASSF